MMKSILTLSSLSRRLAATTLLLTLPWGAQAQGSTPESPYAGQTIGIAVANEIPYGYTNLKGEAQGVGPDVAQAVLATMGIKDIKWTSTAFSSLIPGLQARHFDMVAAEMAILPARCDQVLFSEPNSSYGEGLLVAQGNPQKIHSYQHFVDHDSKVAIMAGADQLDILNALGVPQERIVTLANNADAISTVSTGRADAYAATSATVAQLAELGKRTQAAQPFEDPMINDQAVRSWGAFAFHPEAQTLAQDFNKALLAFKQTQAWRDILATYGFTELDMQQASQRTQAQLCGK